MKNKCALCAVASILAVIVAGFILLIIATTPSRNYNVAIDSVSGLHLPTATDQLDPQFNLTLRFTSTNPLRRECMDADSYLQVSYRCTQLAVAALSPDHRLCVGPKKSTEVRFVAKGTGVRLPGPLMDSLAADMRNGVEAFDLKLLSRDSFSVVSCGARRVGDGGVWCGYLWDKCAPPKDTTASDAVIFYTPISIPPQE